MAAPQYAILRFAKYKGPEISGIEAHNERTKEKYASNPDIDPTRTHLNFHLIKLERKYRVESERQIKEAGCRTRSDSIRVVEALVTASPEFFKSKKKADMKAYFQEAVDFIKQHQSPETIISAVVHLDEKNPHMHLCFVPLTEDKRLCAKEIVGNRKKLIEWQDKFWEHMVKKYPDLERGESASETGRDHIMVGYYLEYEFPEKQVRYIAVSENEDTKKGLSDFVPFKNLFNEWFAKDTSRKVKTALHAKFAAGERTFAYAPLGYIRHPEIKNAIVIDVETRWIIEKIFDLAYHGAGAAKIARVLVDEHVPTAGWLNYQRYGTFAHIYECAPEEKSYAWTLAQVKSILKDETYIGNSVHNKQTNISYKNKKKVRKPEEEWFRVENTHEAIISKKVFEQVQEQIASRRRQQKDATTQIFSGLVKCADCGWSMRFGTNRQNSKPYSHYTCSQYGQGLKQCSAHYIRHDYLYHYVLTRIQDLWRQAQLDETELLHRLLKGSEQELAANAKRQSAELTRAEKRRTEVDRKFAKLYEDWSDGRITEYNFNMMSQKYQTEQQELTEKIERLTAGLESEKQTTVDAETWISLLKQYANPTELTAELLNTLIEKIVIHEATTVDGMREQNIDIYYRQIGKIE